MTTETMTIHRALAELKVLGSRITKEIEGATFVETNKRSNTKINGKTIDSFNTDVVSAYQKINDLIKRREAIKKAVTQSNAETKVTIGDKEMTVAEAIEYKSSGIVYKEKLLVTLASQYNFATKRLTLENGERLEEKVNKHINMLFGSDKKENVDTDAIEKERMSYIDINALDLIDPLDASKKIEALKDEIDRFKIEVDSALSVSNAKTEITINY